MDFKILLTAGVAAAACAASVPADAAPLLFDFSGPSGTAVFQLDSNPTPGSYSSFLGSDQFSFSNVAGVFGGMAGTASNISFSDGLFAALNINAANVGFSQFVNPTLFTGTASAPVFLTGAFTLINPFFGNATLTISPVTVAGVPEAATWAMMLIGFGTVGLAMRRRSSKITTAFSFSNF